MSQRIQYLDTARGIVFFVLLSHSWFRYMNYFTFWDVQVFFILSGIFLTSNNNLENSLFKKIKGLLYPFLLFSIPIYALRYCYALYNGDVKDLVFFP